MEKEYLYVGYYIDINGNFILKIGTTNDLKRRRTEHNRNYKKSPNYTMPKDSSFEYLWSHRLSKYNTLRFEDRNRELWKEMEIGEFVRNDRFVLCKVPNFVPVKIRKTYQIALVTEGDFLCILPIDFLSWSCMAHTTRIRCQ
jgi:predicted GIY-YIG superfamily endonuclease